MRLLQAGRELGPVLCTRLGDRRGQDGGCRSLRGWAGPRAIWQHLATPGNLEPEPTHPGSSGVKWTQVRKTWRNGVGRRDISTTAACPCPWVRPVGSRPIGARPLGLSRIAHSMERKHTLVSNTSLGLFSVCQGQSDFEKSLEQPLLRVLGHPRASLLLKPPGRPIARGLRAQGAEPESAGACPC